jgi:hypothetical protein
MESHSGTQVGRWDGQEMAPPGIDSTEHAPRRQRADAQRNVGALLEAAKTVFATSGVDAPAKAITDLAVLQREMDVLADAGSALSATHEPKAALAQWLHRYTEFVGTKRGLAAAMHSGDPAFDALPGYFMQLLEPVVGSLLDAATATGELRTDVSAKDVLHAVALLCQPVAGEALAHNQHLVAIFADGLAVSSPGTHASGGRRTRTRAPR